MIVAAVALAVELPHTASAATCHVRNARTGEDFVGDGPNLQDAIDGAERGDTLVVRGRCVGSFTLVVRLRLQGRPTRHLPLATLDADDAGHVLETGVSARIEDLALQGGRAHAGGGILQTGGRVVLSEATTVRRNVAESGGGAYVRDGTLVLTDRAVVRGNLADRGGGVTAVTAKAGGSVQLKRSSSVRGNRAREDGGGIYGSIALIKVAGNATVRGNVAGRDGGGIADFDGFTELRGHAAIVHNVARRDGGGWFGFFANGRVCSPHVRISPNVPDDPPDVTVEHC